MSTILTEFDKTNGVAAAVAGFVIGETIAVAIPVAAENARVIAGNSAVDRKLAEVMPAGMFANIVFGAEMLGIQSVLGTSSGELEVPDKAMAAVGVK
jgi:hypothetical protein